MVKELMAPVYFLVLLVFVLIVLKLTRRRWWRKEHRPEKSLILVVRNQQEMIEGILRKATYLRNGNAANTELIVIDNGSRDETPGIIARLARYSGGFIFINTARDTGPQETVELGVEMSRGEKICYFDLQKKTTFYDIYNGLEDAIKNNPQRHFLPRRDFLGMQDQNRTPVPVENKTWGN